MMSNVPSTPRREPDIDLSSPLNYGHIQVETTSSGSDAGPQLFIWGTNVSASQFRIKFKHFIETFKDSAVEEDEAIKDFSETRPLYLRKLNEIQLLDEPILNLNCGHLCQASRELYEQLINYPQEVIPTMDMAINEMFNDIYPDTVLSHKIQVCPFNSDKTKCMRLLNPEDIDTLVTISGMVIRTSNILPKMEGAYFKCTVCSYGVSAEIDGGKILEPVLCPNCNTNFSFTLIHNRSTFVEKQMILLQEDLEDTPVGETPYMAALFAHRDLVNKVRPGDRITVTGIYKKYPPFASSKDRDYSIAFKVHIDVGHLRTVDTRRLREETEGRGLNLSPERIKMIQELSKKPDIYERLARAIAPSIYEHEDVKKGILLQLFGGTSKDDDDDTGRGRERAEINILLCGDPGTSKSQLLKYVFDLVPRSQYTSGEGLSAGALTAVIKEDPYTNNILVQKGALVLADNGICCIDEFDKMNESTRSILHEVMEQQTLSIAKAGIICQLNARTSVLAAANPLESQWNQNKTLVENVHLPHTLLSRFDLIFLSKSSIISDSLIMFYFDASEDCKSYDTLDMGVLRDYIAYAKDTCFPRLSEGASQKLITTYVEMRKIEQKESLIRLAEAHAKIRLSKFVEVLDVEEAWRILSCSIGSPVQDDEMEQKFATQEKDEHVPSIIWPRALANGARVYDGFSFPDSTCINCESKFHETLHCKNPPILRCENSTTFTWPILPSSERQPEGWLPSLPYKCLLVVEGEEAGAILSKFHIFRRKQENFSREQIQIIFNLLFFDFCCFHCGSLLHGGSVCQNPNTSLKHFRDHIMKIIQNPKRYASSIRTQGSFKTSAGIPTLRQL